MQTKEFEKAYKQLNPEQKQAVDIIDGPVMVVAGPGTGKTQILSLRIANILLQTDTQPENILALTFTESGVANMRVRLVELIGSPAYQVRIATFHGFANDVIRNNPEEFPRIIGARSITQVEQISQIEDVLNEGDFEILKPFGDPLYYVRAIQGAISDLKREGVTVDKLEDIVKEAQKQFKKIDDLYYESGAHKGKMRGKYKTLEKQINKNTELARAYKGYQDLLQQKRLYDFDDMIMETLRALEENEDLLLRLQEEHQYLLVDEHQDTNNAQNKILERLASHFAPRPNLFVVGDEKQSIFRFQGASLENFLYFKRLYPEAVRITLKENYRSQQHILDSAHSLIAGEVPLKANTPYEHKPIELVALSRAAVSGFFIAQDVKRKIDAGVLPHDIAVLYRDNKDAFPIAKALERMDVPYRIESDSDVFTEPQIRKLLSLARSVDMYGDSSVLAEALHADIFDITPLDVFKLLRAASQKRGEKRQDVFSFIASKDFEELELENSVAIQGAYEKISHWVKRSKNIGIVALFEEIVRESGLLEQILSSDSAQDELDILDAFFDEVRSLEVSNPQATLRDFFLYLQTVQAHNLYVKKKKTGDREGFVRLMTTHRSKGLEFEYVYISGVTDGKWGNRKRAELLPLLPVVYNLSDAEDSDEEDKDLKAAEQNDDERRLFYVALTRAKQQVTVCYAREGDDGREQMPSQFIREIKEGLIEAINPAEIEREFEEKRGEQLMKTLTKPQRSLGDPAFMKDLFLKQGLSVSALNNYLSCPWKYFYRNLVRLPEPIQPHLLYGTAMHAALEQLFKKRSLGDDFGKPDMLKVFEREVSSAPFRDEDREKYTQRGKDSLSGWYDEYSERFITNVKTEFAIRGVVLTPEVTLTGKLDKLEMLSETEVNVVDYKTGKPKTRNMILGKTKAGDASVWRQLVFYKLLLNMHKEGQYEMVSGEIDFVEPASPAGGPDASSGKYRKEKFIVEQEDVDDFVEQIKVVANEIMTLSFWDKYCDDVECKYCALAKLVK